MHDLALLCLLRLRTMSECTADRSPRHKYFSPTERLRFSQQSSEHKRKKLRRKGHKWLSTSSSSTFRASPDDTWQHRRESTTSSTSRFDQEDVTVDDALWFLTLPDKVKRHHLDREEQASFTERCERTLDRLSPDSAIDYPQRQLSIDQNTGVATICFATLPCDDLDESVFNESDTSSTHSFEAASEADMQFLKLNHQRPASAVSTSAVSNPIQNQTPPSSPPAEPSAVSASKVFLARSLRPLNLPPPRLAPPKIAKSPSPTPARNSATFRNFSRPHTAQSLHVSQHPSVNTTYTQDFDTHRLVRHYLTTPEMIEETVEIPSTPPPEPTTPQLPVELPGDLPGGYTFWNSDEDDDDDELYMPQKSPSMDTMNSEDEVEPSAPTRLNVTNEYHHAIAHCGSVDSGVVMPSQFNTNSFTGGHRQSSSVDRREILMHMLPSRADYPILRQLSFSVGDDNALEVDMEEPDPLALEALPISDDMTGAQGAFAVRGETQSKGLKRVWKSLRRH